MTWLSDLIGRLFASLLSWIESWRKDSARVDAAKEAAVESADDMTDEVIGEIADERSHVSQSDDPDTIARRLRERISDRSRNSGSDDRD